MRRKTTFLAAGILILTCGSAHARFLSADPVKTDQKDGTNFNRYWYANNNPYRFTDPDGREIRPLNPAQAARIESDVNAQASEEFRFDSNNKLQSVGPNPAGGSQSYSASLNAGISSNTTISVGYQQTYTDSSGASVNIDTQHGGGLTGQTGSGNIVVLASGNSLQTTDAAGNAITDTSADIIRHEFVGHAVPQALAQAATGSISNASGNAISNDNATRQELGKPALPVDPSHTEYQP